MHLVIYKCSLYYYFKGPPGGVGEIGEKGILGLPGPRVNC